MASRAGSDVPFLEVYGFEWNVAPCDATNIFNHYRVGNYDYFTCCESHQCQVYFYDFLSDNVIGLQLIMRTVFPLISPRLEPD